jgi:hypothetical protein
MKLLGGNSVAKVPEDVIFGARGTHRRDLHFTQQLCPGGSRPMASKEECIRYATECLSLAQRASDPADRAHLLRMAQAWRDLADKRDGTTADARDKS